MESIDNMSVDSSDNMSVDSIDNMSVDNYISDDSIDNYMSDYDFDTYSNENNEESEGDEEYEEQEDRTVNEEFDTVVVHETDNKKATRKEELTSCIIVTNIDGHIERCGKHSKNQRTFWNLVGVWEVDTSAVEQMKNEKEKLGICYAHYILDRKLHKPDDDDDDDDDNICEKSYTSSVIRGRRCAFCNKTFGVFSRGNGCEMHCWSFLNKPLQTPCVGQRWCPAIGKTGFPPLVKKTTDVEHARYICCVCYESQGGHLQKKEEEKEHDNDVDKSLKLLTNWMVYVTQKGDTNLKNRVLKHAAQTLQALEEPEDDNISTVTPFMIRTILKTHKIPLSESELIDPETSRRFGKNLAKNIWNSRSEINQRKDILETPSSLAEYQSAFPPALINLFVGILSTFFKKRRENNRKKTNQTTEYEISDSKKVDRMTAFLASVILTTAFKNRKIWITRTMASVCHKPKLLPSLRSLFESINVISHTSRHEYDLQRRRIDATDPASNIQTGPRIWNVCVIDNIDMAEATYERDNIYNKARKTFHATLRAVFQFTLPTEIDSISNDEIQLTETHRLFGTNNQSELWVQKVSNVIKTLIDSKWPTIDSPGDVDANTIYQELVKDVIFGCCRVPKANVVILEAGDEPNCDENIYKTCQAYYNDLKLADSDNLYIWADQAIYGRLVHVKNDHNLLLRLGLGQWHTSKAMCGTLITIFSSYGIYNCALELGAKYLDKLEGNVDYRSTCNVLETIWASAGIAIHHYLILIEEKLNEKDIMDSKNNLVKVWYLFYKWTSIWKGHKTGIRTGNFDMQFSNLAAFAPLFASGGKHQYSRAVVHFLSEVTQSSQLHQLLQHVGSVNLTREGHYLAFDEALEFFGVKFIKQNMTQRIITDANFKRHIKSAQSERAITDLLFSELSDVNANPGEHAIKSRYEAVQQLAKKMFAAFINSNDNDGLFRDCMGLTTEGYSRMFNVYSDGEHRLERVYFQEILHIEPVNTAGTAMIAVPNTRASNVTYNTDVHSTTPSEQMIFSDDLPNDDPLTEMLDPIVAAAIIHYELCKHCGSTSHEANRCRHKYLPSSFWLNETISRKYKLANKSPNGKLGKMAEIIRKRRQMLREEISSLQALPYVDIPSISN